MSVRVEVSTQARKDVAALLLAELSQIVIEYCNGHQKVQSQQQAKFTIGLDEGKKSWDGSVKCHLHNIPTRGKDRA